MLSVLLLLLEPLVLLLVVVPVEGKSSSILYPASSSSSTTVLVAIILRAVVEGVVGVEEVVSCGGIALNIACAIMRTLRSDRTPSYDSGTCCRVGEVYYIYDYICIGISISIIV